MKADPERIRPSVYFLALVLSLGCGLALWAAFDENASATLTALVTPDEATEHARPFTWRDEGTRHAPRASRATGEHTHHDWSQPSELTEIMSLELPDPGFWARQRSGNPRDWSDPQMFSMWRSFQSGGEDEPDLPFEPTARHATLVDSEGDVIQDPTTCAVRVLPTRAGGFNCLVRVMCDGEVLYPDSAQQAGYVPCDIEDGRPVRAVDDGQTSRDGDPQVNFDLARGMVTVADYDETGQMRYRATLLLNQS